MNRFLILAMTLPFSCAALAGPDSSEMPQPVRDMPTLEVHYKSNTHGSVPDAEHVANNSRLMEPINAYEVGLGKLGDAFLADKDPATGAQAGAWLKTWAEADALTGPKKLNAPGDVERHMFLCAAAINYLKVKPALAAQDRKVIEKWLLHLAARNQKTEAHHAHTNNLGNWCALGLMATGMATDRQDLVADAKAVYTRETGAIRDDGTLDEEMDRAAKALGYHDFATAPLVIMAELSRKMGEDWYAIHPGRLELLEDRVLYGHAHPEWFARKAGVATVENSGHAGCWAGIYAKRHPENKAAQEALENWSKHERRIGSSMDALLEAGFFEPAGAAKK